MRRLVPALVAVVAVAVLVLGTASGFPGANGTVVFERGGTLFTMDSAGNGQTALVAGTRPSVSPDGAVVAYVDGTIKTVPIGAGTAPADTTRAGSAPSWSPDGAKLVFTDGGGDIRTMNPDGTGLSGVLASGSNPVFSPNGATIAYDRGGQVYTIPAGGGTETNRSQSGGSNADPTWSPDGSRIAFVSTRDGSAELYAMNANGTGQLRLTTNALTEAAPSWSPDGTEIAVAVAGAGIWAVNVSTGARRELTSTAGDATPDWAVGFSISVGSIQEGVADGTILDGETLTLPAGAVTFSGPGTPTGSPSYQWLRCNLDGESCVAISGATGSSYVVDGNVGSTIRVRVTIESTSGAASGVSPATPAVVGAAPANLSSPTITGGLTATQGVALTATTGTWSGTTPIAFTYAWLRCDADGGSCAAISGANASTYLPVADDVGKTLRVRVTASNGFGSSASATSDATEPVASRLPTNTVPPAITTLATTIQVGTSLSATTGTWVGAPTILFRYQWQRCNPDGTGCVNILLATSLFYTVTAADIGRRLRIEVTATNSAGSAKATSDPTITIEGSPPVNVTRPTVTGTPAVGQVLFATVGTWTGTTPFTYLYEWRRCNASGASCSTIAGATSSSYVAATADLGATLAVAVTARNASGSATVVSAATAVVTAGSGGAATRPTNTRVPSFTGVLARGKVLRAVNGTWTGTTPMTFSYHWQRCPRTGTTCTAIPLATRSTYTLLAADVGRRIRLQVTAGNAAGSSVAVSAISRVVAATAPAGPKRIRGTARNDRLVGTNGPDRIEGLGGNDRIDGRRGRDTLLGGPGNDTILAVDGQRDVVDCGPGRDTATVDQLDVVRNCERVSRRTVPRLLVGSGRADRLTGTNGADRIEGLGGNDRIDGRRGRDILLGGPGNDTILAADGERDVVDCGPGRDTATVDRVDVVRNCERVTRRG